MFSMVGRIAEPGQNHGINRKDVHSHLMSFTGFCFPVFPFDANIEPSISILGATALVSWLFKLMLQRTRILIKASKVKISKTTRRNVSSVDVDVAVLKLC